MNRRAFCLTAAASPLLGWIDPARAQPAKPSGKLMRVGVLRLYPTHGGSLKIFVGTLRNLGWIEGRNISYDYASADGDEARLPEAAVALVARRPDAIYAYQTPLARAASGATRTIPIVFSSANDPVRDGLVKSMRSPGGNVTGVANIAVQELGGRRMQLLKEALPGIAHVGVLVTDSHDSSNERRMIEQAAGAGVKISSALMLNAADHGAFSALLERKPQALLLTHTAVFMRQSERKLIFQLADKYRIPVAGYRSEQAEDGALFSYNSNLDDHTRRAAYLMDKILRGAKPAEIPVEQPTKFELVINLKTAKTLGITIPQSVMLQASRVIE